MHGVRCIADQREPALHVALGMERGQGERTARPGNLEAAEHAIRCVGERAAELVVARGHGFGRPGLARRPDDRDPTVGERQDPEQPPGPVTVGAGHPEAARADGGEALDRGLGVGDPKDIEVVGIDISGINFGFTKDEDTFASWGQKKIYWGPLHFLEKPLLRSPIVPWSYFASNVYYNLFWYPLIGRGRVKAARQTEWGKLFDTY